MKKVLFFAILCVGLALIARPTAQAVNDDNCPNTGGGWVKIDSNDLSAYPVSGATEYCFKAGNSNSRGCTGGKFGSWPQPDGTCGLSHWSYFVPVSTPTPSPTPICTPTPTPTPVVSPSPTATPVATATPTPTPVVSPSPTATPVVTATPTPSATPTPTATPVVTPSVTPSATPTATPIVSASPTATPIVQVTPTPTPSVTPVPSMGRGDGFELTGISCTVRNFDAKYSAFENGNPIKGVKVRFEYMSKVVNTETNDQGLAQAGFGFEGVATVYAYPEGRPSINARIDDSTEICDNGVGGGSVLGVITQEAASTTTPSNGQILGLASTGVIEDMMMRLTGILGGGLITVGSYLYGKKKINA